MRMINVLFFDNNNNKKNRKLCCSFSFRSFNKRMANSTLQLPIIDLCSSSASAALSIREACLDCGFFYVINHGLEQDLLRSVFEESRKFFNLPVEEKLKLSRKNHRGYTPLYSEKLDLSLTSSKGDSKESFYIGPLEEMSDLNQWPQEALLPFWRLTMEDYYKNILDVGRRILSLIALALNLEEDFFRKSGALNQPNGFLRLLHYPGDLELSGQEVYGASAHSDYGMITLLTTDGVRGLQVCRDRLRQPQVWEDVHHIDRAFIVNIGDMLERWTNCLFRSTLHRVLPTGQERYSMAFFLDPNPNCLVECLSSCCSETFPPKYPPIRAGDYLQERLRLTYA